MNSGTPNCSGRWERSSKLLSKFSKIDFKEFLIIFRRWLNTVLTTRKNNFSLQGNTSVLFRTSLITPEVTLGGGKNDPGKRCPASWV
jgi:hypothetical protein